MFKNIISASIALIFFSSISFAHESFGLQVGQDKNSIKYKLIKKVDLSVGIDNLEDGYSLDKYDSDECYEMIQDRVWTAYNSYTNRTGLTKEQKKLRKKAIKGKRNDVLMIRNPTDPTFGNKLELGWYSVDARQTCLVFWENKLVSIYLNLYAHNIGQDFYDNIPEPYTMKNNKEHGISDPQYPGFQTDGSWRHDENDWFVFFPNFSYLSTRLIYTNQKKMDLIVNELIGHKEG